MIEYTPLLIALYSTTLAGVILFNPSCEAAQPYPGSHTLSTFLSVGYKHDQFHYFWPAHHTSRKHSDPQTTLKPVQLTPVLLILHQQLNILYTDSILTIKNGLTIENHVRIFNRTCTKTSDCAGEAKSPLLAIG